MVAMKMENGENGFLAPQRLIFWGRYVEMLRRHAEAQEVSGCSFLGASTLQTSWSAR